MWQRKNMALTVSACNIPWHDPIKHVSYEKCPVTELVTELGMSICKIYTCMPKLL